MDYPKKRLANTNDNEQLVCFYCNKTEKEINNRIDNHAQDCKFRLKHQG